uniref:ATP-dependent Clp protease proteolytic subunit n=1 Tax=Ananas comosus var. bracteatus TaxID=296719 RepID=A0A6V7PWZ3_ANACO|nr:unnamed protein product [Ananas comosus var. bracteatus]
MQRSGNDQMMIPGSSLTPVLASSTPTAATSSLLSKVLIPIGRIKDATPSKNVNNPDQKYIEIATVDDFEFWSMGPYEEDGMWAPGGSGSGVGGGRGSGIVRDVGPWQRRQLQRRGWWQRRGWRPQHPVASPLQPTFSGRVGLEMGKVGAAKVAAAAESRIMSGPLVAAAAKRGAAERRRWDTAAAKARVAIAARVAAATSCSTASTAHLLGAGGARDGGESFTKKVGCGSLAVLVDQEFALLLGDSCRDFVKTFGGGDFPRRRVRNCEPEGEGGCPAAYLTKTRFRGDGKEHEITITYSGVGVGEAASSDADVDLPRLRFRLRLRSLLRREKKEHKKKKGERKRYKASSALSPPPRRPCRAAAMGSYPFSTRSGSCASAVTDDTECTVLLMLLSLAKNNRTKPVHLLINSPGGIVSAGLAIYDTIQSIPTPVATLCLGEAASMTSLLLTVGAPGQHRALPNSRIMTHQPSGGFLGQASDKAIHAKEILKLCERFYAIYARHTHQPVHRIEPDSINLYIKAYENSNNDRQNPKGIK